MNNFTTHITILMWKIYNFKFKKLIHFLEKQIFILSMWRRTLGYGRQVLESVTIYCYFPLGMVATTAAAE
jgi:hypothetical protein